MNLLDTASLQGQSFDWLASLAGTSLKGIMALAAAGLLSLALGRGRAAVRHALWCVSLCGFLLMPLLSYAIQGWQLAVLPPNPFMSIETRELPSGHGGESPSRGAGAARNEGGANAAATGVYSSVMEGRGVAVPAASAAATRDAGALEWPGILMLLWLSGVSAVLFRLLVGLA